MTQQDPGWWMQNYPQPPQPQPQWQNNYNPMAPGFVPPSQGGPQSPQQYNTTFNPNYRGSYPAAPPPGWGQQQTRPQSWNMQPQGNPYGPQAQPYGGGSSGPGFQTPFTNGFQPPAPWQYSQYDPNNPGGVPQDYWGDQNFLMYTDFADAAAARARDEAQRAQQQSQWAASFGANQAQQGWQNNFQTTEAQRQADQWGQTFNANNAQNAWSNNFQQGRANTQDAQWGQQFDRSGRQWDAEYARNQALDQWNQAFSQAGFDWQKQQGAEQNRLTEQGQNLGAFGRRFGPNVAYM